MFTLLKERLRKRWQNDYGQDGKNGRVRDEGFELKYLTFLATEVKR